MVTRRTTSSSLHRRLAALERVVPPQVISDPMSPPQAAAWEAIVGPNLPMYWDGFRWLCEMTKEQARAWARYRWSETHTEEVKA